MQTLEYKEGYQAYLDGETKENNPYKDDADKYDDWLNGYFDAMEDEDELDKSCPECGEDGSTRCGAVGCKY